MKKIRVFLLNGLILTATSFGLQAIGMYFSVYISNKIGSEAIGMYQLIMSVYMFSITLATSGINLAITRIVAEQLAYGFEGGIKKVVKKGLCFSLFCGGIVSFCLFFFAPDICQYWLHSKISPLPLQILAISLPFLAMSSCLQGYFSAIRKVHKTACSQIFEQLLQIYLVSMFLNHFMPNGLDNACLSLVLGSTIAEGCSFIYIFFLYLRDKQKLKNDLYQDTNYTKQILRISGPMAITSYIRSGLSTYKQLIIPRQLEKSGLDCSKALSCYGLINGMVMPLLLFPGVLINSFSNLLIPEFSSLNARNRENGIHSTISKILKFCFIFSFLVMGIFWCFSNQIATAIYHSLESSTYIKILCPLVILMYMDKVVDSILKGLDKQVPVMIINIADLVITILFIFLLVPTKGLIGYVIALFVSEFFNGIASLWLLIRTTKLKFPILDWLVKPILAIAFVNLIFTFTNASNTEVLSLVFNILAYIILYTISIILLRGFVKEDFKF